MRDLAKFRVHARGEDHAVFRRHVEPADWRGFPVGGFIDERHARQVIKNSINITTEHSGPVA
jgi:hypothetical protein